MSVVYTSSINSLVINSTYTDASGNFFPYSILKVNWIYTAAQNGYNYSIYPQIILEVPKSGDFTDNNSLTETEIFNWVFAKDINISLNQEYL